jgi:putative hydrolase of the HAD superfamily
MLLLKTKIPNYSSIKNIIFDFGGVVCDLDIQRSVEKFKEFGPGKSIKNETQEEKDRQFEMLVSKYETGLITSGKFRNNIREYYQTPPSDTAIDDAWNALLVGIPEPRMMLLESIKKNYRIFLLSNSNEIHYLEYTARLRQQYGYHDFSVIFKKTYFSYQCHLKKPDPLIFKLVLNENNLDPSVTLFIDDTQVNVKTACDLGLTGYQLRDGEEITDLFYTP